MKTCPVIGIVLLMGAGVIWVCRVVETRPGNSAASQQSGFHYPVAQEKEKRHDAESRRPAVQSRVGLEKPAARDVGNALPAPPSSRAVRMKVTAYCVCEICCEGWSKFARTATGDNARIYDGVAADPKLLPYRTRLEIPGIGIREVDDTGGAMRQDARRGITHIDVRMASHAEARRFGVKRLDVKVLK